MGNTDHINALCAALLVIIPVGAAARVVYCLIARTADEEEAKSYNSRIRNALIFAVVSEPIVALLKWAGSYF